MTKFFRVLFAVLLTISLIGAQAGVRPVQAEPPVEIDTAAELAAIGSSPAALAGSYLLTADIDLSSISNWTALGSEAEPFTGYLDGADHVIRGLTLANTQTANQGLFGVMGEFATVSNLRIEGARVTAADHAGILAGTNAGQISRVSVEGIVSGANVVGGLVGSNTITGAIYQAYAIAAVSGRNNNGGLVGENAGWLSETYAASSVSAAVTNTYLEFDGIDDYILIDHDPAYVTGNFTLEAWFQWTAANRADVSFIIGKGLENFEIHTGGGSGANGIRFIPVRRTDTLYNDTRAYQDIPNVLQPGWNHVAASWDYDNEAVQVSLNGIPQDIYQNGANVGKVASLPLASVENPLGSNTSPFFIGARNTDDTPSMFFKGNISDVRFWTRVRTPEEIAADKYRQLTGNEEGLVGYWKLDGITNDEGTINVSDSSTYQNDGIVLGGATVTTVPSVNGGLVAVNNGWIENSYYDSTVSGLVDDTNGVHLDSAQMKSPGNFFTWVFPDAWRIDPGKTYPSLFEVSVPVQISSVSPVSPAYGQPYTVQVSVGSHPIGQATGSVTVADGSGASCNATLTAGSPSTGSCSLTSAAAGNKTLTANYGGSAVFAANQGSEDITVVDQTAPQVTLEQAAGQGDPTLTQPVYFTATFNEPINPATFTGADVTLTGDADGASIVLSELEPLNHTTYRIAVSGLSGSGTFSASIPEDMVEDVSGNGNTASTSTDNQVTYDVVPPAVTVNRADGQADPTRETPVNFTVVFSEPVNLASFTTEDLLLAGTASADSASITQVAPNDGTTFNVSVSGMTQTGTVALAIGAGAVQDLLGNGNLLSTAVDNLVDYDVTLPDVSISQAAGQVDPTNTGPVNFTAVFSEPINPESFTPADVLLSGTAGATTAAVSEAAPNDGTTFNLAVSGMTGTGTVQVSIPVGVVEDLAGNTNTASTSTDNEVTYDVTLPGVTVNLASGQADPTHAAEIKFSVLFSRSIDPDTFDSSDVDLSASTAEGSLSASVTEVEPEDGTTFEITVTGMTGPGMVSASLPLGAVLDLVGNPSTASTSADNQVEFDNVQPQVTINQAADQLDPVNTGPVRFTAVFSELIDAASFTGADLDLSGSTTPDVLAASVSEAAPHDGTTFLVEVTGMTGSGTVAAAIPGGSAQDLAGNLNLAATATDYQVEYDVTVPTVTVEQADDQAGLTNQSPVYFTATFSEAVDPETFTASDVSLSGDADGAVVALVETAPNDGTTFRIAVSGLDGQGEIRAAILAGQVLDPAGNGNTASTSEDHQVWYDYIAPAVTVNQAGDQSDPTNAAEVRFQVVFSEPISLVSFTAADLTLAASSGSPSAVIHETAPLDGTTFEVVAGNLTGQGSVSLSIGAGKVLDPAGNTNRASTSTDHQVAYDRVAPAVTVNQADGQSDPAAVGPVYFLAVFSEPVAAGSFTSADVSLVGSTAAGELAVQVSQVAPNDGTTFRVAVSGMTGHGTIQVSIPAGAAKDLAGNDSGASTSTDNQVTYATAKTPVELYLTVEEVTTLVSQTWTLKVTVTGGQTTPTGTVTFKNGSEVLGSVPLSDGSAVLEVARLTGGQHAISVEYSGDETCAGGFTNPVEIQAKYFLLLFVINQ